MKIKKFKRRKFRHLTDEDLKNPLLPLVELCCSETSLNYVAEDTHRFIRATAGSNTGFTGSDYAEMYFFYERFCKHIELLYVLMHRFPDWQLAKDGPLYRTTVMGLSKEVYDGDMFGGTTMQFDKLTQTEFWNLHQFMKSFFAFRTLAAWQYTLNDMMRCIFGDEPFSQYDEESFRLFEYLDKLGEAMFLAYLIRGKDHMLGHCANRFGIKKKKLVDADSV